MYLQVLLESVASFGLSSTKSRNCSIPVALSHSLLVFSAQHPDSVQAMLQGTESYLTRSLGNLKDVAYSLASRRELHSHRAFCVTDGKSPLQISPIVKSNITSPEMIWVFTGQGAQWAQMGKELLEQEPLFKQRIDILDSVLAGLPDPPSWNLTSKPRKGHNQCKSR
jgi:acyl transferase domain-containing protein